MRVFQRALLEQKQKKKRQEPLMVQSNLDGRSRTRRTRQSEEQAPLVESYLSSNSSTIYHGRKITIRFLSLLQSGSSAHSSEHSRLENCSQISVKEPHVPAVILWVYTESPCWLCEDRGINHTLWSNVCLQYRFIPYIFKFIQINVNVHCKWNNSSWMEEEEFIFEYLHSKVPSLS